MLSAIREVKSWTWEMCAPANRVTRPRSVKLAVRVSRAQASAHVQRPTTQWVQDEARDFFVCFSRLGRDRHRILDKKVMWLATSKPQRKVGKYYFPRHPCWSFASTGPPCLRKTAYVGEPSANYCLSVYYLTESARML